MHKYLKILTKNISFKFYFNNLCEREKGISKFGYVKYLKNMFVRI